MVVHVEVRQVEIAVLQHHQYAVVLVELAQQPAVLIVVQPVHVGVEPYLTAAQRRVSVTLQSDAVHCVLGQQVTLRGASLDEHLREVLLHEYLLQLRVGVERDLDDLRLAVGVGCEVEHARARRALCQVVFLVAGDARHVESLDEVESLLAVTIHHVVGRALVVLLEHRHMHHVLAHENLLRHTNDLVFSVFVEDNQVVDVRAVAHKLVFLESCSDESLLSVDEEFLVGLHHLGGLDGVEVLDFGESRMVGPVFVLDVLEPVGRHLHHVVQVAVDASNLFVDAGNQLVGLVLVEFQDALHLDFEQSQDVVLGHLAHHLRVVRRQAVVNMFAHRVDVRCLLKFPVFIDALLDEDLLQRAEVQLLQQFVAFDLQFLSDEAHGAVHRVAQHVAHGEELRLVVLNHAAVGRDVHLAVGKRVERVDGLVRRHAGSQVHLNLHLGRCQVGHVARLDLAFLNSFGDALNQGVDGLREGNLANDKRLLVLFLNLRTHLQHTAALSVVIFRHVDAAARQEVGVQLERLSVQVFDGGVAQLIEVVRQNLRRQSYGNALGTLRQQQRKLRRQRDRLFVAAVVRQLPLGGLWVEHHVERKLRQAGFNISGCRRAVARQDVAPVALRVNQQVLLSQLHQCVADARVAVRVKLHGMSHDVRHLVIAAVVHALHRVQDAALHRLQTVLNVRHGPFEDDVRGIVQEPVLIHAAQVVHGSCVEAVHGLVVRVCRGTFAIVFGLFQLVFGFFQLVFGLFQLVVQIIFYIVAHIVDSGFFVNKFRVMAMKSCSPAKVVSAFFCSDPILSPTAKLRKKSENAVIKPQKKEK